MTFATVSHNNLQLGELFSFVNDVIISIERARESTEKLLELIMFS